MPLRGRASISPLVAASSNPVSRLHGYHGIVAVSGLQGTNGINSEEAKNEQKDVGRLVRRGRVYRRNPGGADERNADQSKFKRNHHTDGVSPKG